MALIEPVETSCSRPDKQDIAARFSAAAAQYDAVAGIQHVIADYALSRLPDIQRNCALDIGCGTGRNTAKLVAKGALASGMDLAPGMLKQAKSVHPTITFLQGDAEQLPCKSGCVDVVFSSMALQWCDDPMQVLKEIYRILQPGGHAELAIMVDGSFPELRRAAQTVGIHLVLNKLATAERWLAAVCEHSWGQINHDVASYRDSYDNIGSLLKSINGVGAGSRTDNAARKPLTRNKLRLLSDALRETSADALTNTYQILHISLEKTL